MGIVLTIQFFSCNIPSEESNLRSHASTHHLLPALLLRTDTVTFSSLSTILTERWDLKALNPLGNK